MTLVDLGPLTAGHIRRRYKRFLADVELQGGQVIIAHCPNTGSMESCWAPGKRVELSFSDNPRRKLPWTLERVDMGQGWVGVNTARVNGVIAAAIREQRIPALRGYRRIRHEPSITVDGYPPSRFDLALGGGNHADAFVEIKNATLLRGDVVQFPDAVTVRGLKHLNLLMHVVENGCRGVLVFAVNRPEGKCFEPAWSVDPVYAARLEEVVGRGVEVVAVRVRHTRTGIDIAGSTSHRVDYC